MLNLGMSEANPEVGKALHSDPEGGEQKCVSAPKQDEHDGHDRQDEHDGQDEQDRQDGHDRQDEHDGQDEQDEQEEQDGSLLRAETQSNAARVKSRRRDPEGVEGCLTSG